MCDKPLKLWHDVKQSEQLRDEICWITRLSAKDFCVSVAL